MTNENRRIAACCRCDTETDCCAFCDEPDCERAICYRCVRIALGQGVANCHPHGG